MARITLFAIMMCVISLDAISQTHLSMEEAVRRTLERHPEIKASQLQIDKNRHLEKASINIPNPEIMMESPTGKYHTIGVTQTFDFPTVYGKQRNIAKRETALTIIASGISKSGVIAQILTIYNEAQYQQQLKSILIERDSIYREIAHSASRKFAAGEVDAMAVSYSKLQQAEATRQLSQCVADYESSIETLQLLTGMTTSFQVDEITEFTSTHGLENKETITKQSLFLQYAEGNQKLSEEQLSLERNKFLPGLAIGYMNQAEKDTPMEMRLNAGITIPLWWWQYSGRIKAAKKQVEISQQETEAHKQEITIQSNQLISDLKKYKSSLNYYENDGLSQANAIITNSKRMFDAGSIDYINHLRNMSDAYQQHYNYLETLRNLNQTIIQLNYITSK